MTKKLKLGIIFGALVVLLTVLLWFLHVRHKTRDLPAIVKSGRLFVLADSSSVGFSEKAGNVTGFQYEIVKAFADSLGLELVVTEQNDLKDAVTSLNIGDYDIVTSFVPVTTQWIATVKFTVPLFTSRQVLVQRLSADSVSQIQVKKIIELANDTIYIPAHSPYTMRLKNLSDEIAHPIHLLEMNNQSTEQMVRMVATGKIKQTICDEQFAQKLKVMYPNIDVSLPLGFEQQLAWMVHLKSPLLLQKLNDFLTDFIGSSAYWEIYRKYY